MEEAVAGTTLKELHSLEHWRALAEVYGLRLLGAVLILLLGLWLAKRLSRTLDRVLERTHTEATLRGFLRNIAYAAMVVVVILAALQYIGFAPASLFAVLGAAGLGIGLALKDSLSNLVAGFQLIVQRPFRAGDYVITAGLEGTVEQVRVFQTRLRTPDNRVVIVPNILITAAAITNFTATLKRRIDIATSLAHGDDLQAARARLIEIATQDARVMQEPVPTVLATGLGADNRLSLELRVWARTNDVLQLRSDLTEAVRNALIEMGIGLPASIRDVRVFHHGADGRALTDVLSGPVVNGAPATATETPGSNQPRG
ncbi:MAG TPA: mechanosensitive ion channel family protein [Lysobacter sp.]